MSPNSSCPSLLFTPQPIAGWAAVAMVVTQLWLVLSGNFAWLNWVTIVLALSAAAPLWAKPSAPLPAPPRLVRGPGPRSPPPLVLVLSYRPARNLLSRRQLMNTLLRLAASGQLLRRVRQHHAGSAGRSSSRARRTR